MNDIPGSSPRVWGQVCNTRICDYKGGIIPTRVGTSRPRQEHNLYYKDHPHACGDKGSYGKLQALLAGSSPRVWGQVGKFLIMTACVGIIPTRVGTRACTCTFHG